LFKSFSARLTSLDWPKIHPVKNTNGTNTKKIFMGKIYKSEDGRYCINNSMLYCGFMLDIDDFLTH
ncbi:hypothetical protein PSQ35_003384, partial [Acinetobacter baumannii]